MKHVPEGFLSTPISAWPTAGALVATPPPPAALVTASPPTAVLEQKVCVEQEPWLVVYLLLGLCLCALICSLLLGWTHLRRKGEVVSCQASAGTCHRREDSSKGECWLRWGGLGEDGELAVDTLPGTAGRDRKQNQFVTGVGRKSKASDVQCG